MAERLGEAYPAFVSTRAGPRVDGLRANDLKLESRALVNPLLVDFSPLEWCPADFAIPSETPLGRHPYHVAGLYYLQEPSAMAVAQVLAPQPGERVLDLCAAPGGKATQIVLLMGDRGLLVTNDIHPRRVQALADNLERWGATNAAVLNETPHRLARHFPAFLDRVLVDAPYSGEGMFRRSELARSQWSVEHVHGCDRRQREILASVARMVRPGRWLCYATCAFSPEENEAAVAPFRSHNPGFQIAEPRRYPGFGRGHPEWVAASRLLARAVRLWPHRAPGEGHFIALMQRVNGRLVHRSVPGLPRPHLPPVSPRLTSVPNT